MVDAFTKFFWLYPVKSTSAHDTLDKLKLQQTTFGNPRCIITDKGPVFTSSDFTNFCEQENIDHQLITTGVPRGNAQIEKQHATLIPILTKLSLAEPEKWYKHVASVQRIINCTTSKATNFSPFELLTGVKMKNKEDIQIKQLLEAEHIQFKMDHKKQLRDIQKQTS